MKKRQIHQHFSWFISFLSLHVFDWIIQLTRNTTAIFQANVYVLSIFMSFLLFYSLGLISNNLPYKIQKITALIISFLLTLLLISHFFIYRDFGDSFSYSMLNFTAENPLYLISFLKTYLLNSKILLAIILFLFYYWVWFPRIDIER